MNNKIEEISLISDKKTWLIQLNDGGQFFVNSETYRLHNQYPLKDEGIIFYPKLEQEILTKIRTYISNKQTEFTNVVELYQKLLKQTKKMEVNFGGEAVGYTEDEGKTITFYPEHLNKIKKILTVGPIFVSSRGFTEVEEPDYNFKEEPMILENEHEHEPIEAGAYYKCSICGIILS